MKQDKFHEHTSYGKAARKSTEKPAGKQAFPRRSDRPADRNLEKRKTADMTHTEKRKEPAGMSRGERGRVPSGISRVEKGKEPAGMSRGEKGRATAGMTHTEKGKEPSGMSRGEKGKVPAGMSRAERNKKDICPVYKKCGSCQLQGIPYEIQLKNKHAEVEKLMAPYGKPEPMIGMDVPLFYRNKVHRSFGLDSRGHAVCGNYEELSHRIVPVSECMIEDRTCQDIIRSIEGMLRSFKIRVYDEDTGIGLLRHVLVRKGFASGQILVVLVCSSPVFPSRNNFIKALREKHPSITSVVLNINDRRTSMVLGERNITLFGKGFIEDQLLGKTYRISAGSFYQVNPVQTEKLYTVAIQMADFKGTETILDAYCGIGTIGLSAVDKVKEVIGVELNKDAVRDAVFNAKTNQVKNAVFYAADAGEFMEELASSGKRIDAVLMDPPRSGSDEKFLSSVVRLSPPVVIYISCNPHTQVRDLKYLTSKGYKVKKIQPVDMFPFCDDIECVCLLSKKNTNRKD